MNVKFSVTPDEDVLETYPTKLCLQIRLYLYAYKFVKRVDVI